MSSKNDQPSKSPAQGQTSAQVPQHKRMAQGVNPPVTGKGVDSKNA